MSSPVPVTPRPDRDRPTHLMSDEELRNEYICLRRASVLLNEESIFLRGEINAICEESVRLQQSTEIEEEKRANQLLRSLRSEEMQKQQFLGLLRREEGARQQIMGQIAQVRAEKGDLEGQLGQQRVVMLQLQKKLMDVVNKKNEAERELLRERRGYLDALSKQLKHLKPVPHLVKGDEKKHVDGAHTTEGQMTGKLPPQELDTEASGAAFSSALGSVTSDTNVAINCLEKKLNHLLQEHATAFRLCMNNEEECAELGKRLETIQQATFLDWARASKMREDLCAAKRRLSELEAFKRGSSVVSEDSSHLPTPTLGSLKSISLRERTREALSARQRRPSSNFPASCDISELGEESHSVP